MTDGGLDDATPGRLLELTVADLALIDRLRLAFDAGFNVITGETGAGKSLLIDALGLALGARADTTLVRHGAESARVEALFDRMPEPLIAVREVAANGRSTARLDDATVTAARLAEEVGPLVEVHGQHDQGRLLDERWQRDLLDITHRLQQGEPTGGRMNGCLLPTEPAGNSISSEADYGSAIIINLGNQSVINPIEMYSKFFRAQPGTQCRPKSLSYRRKAGNIRKQGRTISSKG